MIYVITRKLFLIFDSFTIDLLSLYHFERKKKALFRLLPSSLIGSYTHTSYILFDYRSSIILTLWNAQVLLWLEVEEQLMLAMLNKHVVYVMIQQKIQSWVAYSSTSLRKEIESIKQRKKFTHETWYITKIEFDRFPTHTTLIFHILCDGYFILMFT